MKRILVPTDYSVSAEKAFVYALHLSEKLKSEIILLHSYHTHHTNAYGSAKTIGKEKTKAELLSEAEIVEWKNKFALSSSCKIKCLVTSKDIQEEVLSLVKEFQVDLIVMGTQGIEGKIEGKIFDTNASFIVEKVNCPVIVLPEESERKEIKKIVYATEYLDSDLMNLQKVVEIAKLFEADIHFIHIALQNKNTETKQLSDFEKSVRNQTDYSNISFEIIHESEYEIEEEIENYINNHEVDLLIMSAQQRDWVDKLFGKSFTRFLTLYSNVPLMVFHHKKLKDKTVVVG